MIYLPDIIQTKAEENLNSAKLCLKNKHYNASVNRSYYACAQKATEALLRKNISLGNHPNHKNIREKYNQRFKQIIPRNQNTLEPLFTLRRDADYTDRNTSKTQAINAYRQACDFINNLKTHLQK